ncbi:hypothetical protein CTEN210_03574 [Chaetoceros tenuissimus]|uniref:Leucine-rich repeat domain-containing protein n=1 Tax=Chaetoceros tenuissimus TaxID=426638 RepID=A0AAD3CLS8_9STRA|nr:hypothetical protein CTEN210_03574 [Chaetoceros tenuissimus]
MKLQRKLTNKEWKEIVKKGPGIRNYRGKRTLFYNGEILFDDDTIEPLVYDYEERDTWQVVMVLPGVEVIPEWTFRCCRNVETVIMADTVKRIEYSGFDCCSSLEFVKLSRNLEYIGSGAFLFCESLTSIFIPPSCREIGERALESCTRLIIFYVPQTTMLGDNVIADTESLIEASPFGEDVIDEDGRYQNNERVHAWVKNLNQSEEYALHRACSSFNPITEVVYGIVKRQGLKSFKKENEIGVTPAQYLEENPFADIDQRTIVKRYVIEMMGETV